MTNYTIIKRELQKLGFKPIRLFGEYDIMLHDSKTQTTIRIIGQEDVYYAALRAGEPVSWCNNSIYGPYVRKGKNYHIDEYIAEGTDEQIAHIVYLYDMSHVGHWATNLYEEKLI